VHESSSSEPALVTHRLTKHYGSLTALRNLDLEVIRGEVFGFLGLNGAGKTTAIRIFLDLLRPSAGTARVLGNDCQAAGLMVRRSVGYLPGEMGIYKDMTGQAVLDLMAKLGGRAIDLDYRNKLAGQLELAQSDLSRKLREYSTGMKRKLGIIQAFQCRPPVLILDEPTEGLDPLMKDAFYGLLSDVRREGTTVFMSSHVLSEVERVCDRIGLLRSGEMVLLSSVDGVRKLAPRRVRITFAGEAAPPSELPDNFELLEAQPRRWSYRVRGPVGGLIKLLDGLPVDDIKIDEPHLEDVLVKYYRQEQEEK
jgi:ABC-2 type transport system ATP-binding protein